MAVPVGEALSFHPPLVSHLRIVANHVSGEADHPDCLTNIGPEPHPVEQPDEGFKRPLQPIRVSRRNQSVVREE